MRAAGGAGLQAGVEQGRAFACGGGCKVNCQVFDGMSGSRHRKKPRSLQGDESVLCLPSSSRGEREQTLVVKAGLSINSYYLKPAVCTYS